MAEPGAQGHAEPAPRTLPELRSLIDAVDTQLVRLLNERAKLVMEVGKRKAVDGTPVYAPVREQAVLARVLASNPGPLMNVTLEAIYREIMSGSFALERQLRVGYLGPAGSFSHEAAVKQFGKSVMYENLRTIEGVFEEVARGHVDYGLVPVENASIGSVAETIDGFLKFADRVAICAEVHLSVTQALITAPGARPSDITTIMSKPEALGQCRRWLATQYPHATLVSTASTSAAVDAVAKAYAEGSSEAGKLAAIASKLAAEMHDLPIMFPEVQDASPNITRFLVLCSSRTAAASSGASGSDKTSAIFVSRDRPGALRDILDGFARGGINLSQIEKRPCPPDVLAALLATCPAHPSGSHTDTDGHDSRLPAAPSAAPTKPQQISSNPSSDSAGVPPGSIVPSVTGGRGSAASGFVYAFFIEAEGHIGEKVMADAIAETRDHCVALKVLGSFPKARRVL